MSLCLQGYLRCKAPSQAMPTLILIAALQGKDLILTLQVRKLKVRAFKWYFSGLQKLSADKSLTVFLLAISLYLIH